MRKYALWILLLPTIMVGQKLLPSPFPVGAGGGGGGGGGTAVAPYSTTVTGQTSVSISAATHNQGVLAVAYCFDNSTPRIAVSCDQNYTRDSSGNLVFTFSPSFTGLIEVGSGGGVNGAGAGNVTCTGSFTVGNLLAAANPLGTGCVDSGFNSSGGKFSGPVSVLINQPTTNPAISSNYRGVQVQAGSWAAGIATLTVRTGQSFTPQNGVGGLIAITGNTSSGGSGGSYNCYSCTITAVSSSSISYAVTLDPGTFSTTPFNGLVYVSPTMIVGSNSPFGGSGWFIANSACVTSGDDVGTPIIAAIGPDAILANNSFRIGCDGHSVTIWFGTFIKAFNNGFLDAYTSEHTLGWTRGITSSPITSTNVDFAIGRNLPGFLGIGTAASGGLSDTKGGISLAATQFTNAFSAANPTPTCGAAATVTITNVSTSTPIVVTAANSFSPNDIVTISGVGGATNANGQWRMSSVSSSGFSLVGSVGGSAYTSGGSAVSTPALGMTVLVSDATVAVPGSAYATGGTYTIKAECTFNSSGSVYAWLIN